MVVKVLGFVGSPRKEGNTDLLVQEALKGAKDAGAETSIYYLHDYNISDCRECMGCRQPGAERCVVKDDMQQFYPLIRQADVYIFGTPFWFGYMPGQAKSFLDRWYCFVGGPNALPLGKKFLLLLPLGRDLPDLFRYTAKWMAGVFPFAFPGVKVQFMLAPGVMDKGDIKKRPEYLAQAYQMARQIVQE